MKETNSINDPLKGCPFCGGKAKFEEWDDGNGGRYAHVRCEACGATGAEANCDHATNASAYWNRRALEASA